MATKSGQILGHEVHGSWARRRPDLPWCFEFLLHEIDQDVWSFRYCHHVRHPLEHIGARTPDGISYLRPEIALLYKAARLREVDEQDFRRVLPHLDPAARGQLVPGHHLFLAAARMACRAQMRDGIAAPFHRWGDRSPARLRHSFTGDRPDCPRNSNTLIIYSGPAFRDG